MKWGTRMTCVIASTALYVAGRHVAYIIAHSATTITDHQLRLSTSFSTDAIDTITRTLSAVLPCSLENYKKAITALHARMPSIAHVIITMTTPSTLKTTISAQNPVIIANQQSAFNQQGIMFKARDIAPHARAHCINATVAQLDSQTPTDIQQLYAWALQLPLALRTRYMIEWHNPTTIYLHDTHNKKLSYLISTHSIPTQEQLASCQQLVSLRKNFLSCIADLRFTKQIIMYKKAQGKIYG